jgi:TonB family protein
LKPNTFLSIPLKPWTLSGGIHLFFFLTVILVGRNRTLDLTVIDLDLSHPSLSLSAATRQPDPDAEWRKPMAVLKAPPPPVAVKPQPPPEAPVAPSESGSVRSIAQVSQLPRFKNQMKAQYPESAKRSNIEGVVILQVDIDATGAVKKVELVQSLGYGCDESAVTAAQLSTFTPAYAGGEAVPVRIRIPYRFKFEY